MDENLNFDHLVRTHQGAIRAFLRRLTHNAAQADDLAQTSFLKAYEHRARLRDPKAARSWLFRIAYRTFVDHQRRESRRAGLRPLPDDSTPPPTVGLATDIARAMGGLAPECRAVVMLCLGYGMTHMEAARITGLPLGTVKSHVRRGKLQLQASLAAYEVS